MNGGFIKYKEVIIVALSTSAIGLAGALLYEQYLNIKKRHLMNDIEQLSSSVKEIRRDLDSLKLAVDRNIHISHRTIRQVTGAPSVTTDTEAEMFSTMGGDDLYDEFYELSDNEVVGQEANALSFEEIDTLLDSDTREDKTKAYGVLLEMLEKGDKNDEVLWRLAKACHMMSSIYNVEGNMEKKKQFILEGAEFGERAVKLNDSNWRAHKWFAICVGNRGQLQSTKEKLKDGNLFKNHLDKAIAINSEDAVLHHLLGRFYYEIASLSWLERKLANTLFGQVPQGSYKDAISSLLKAEELHASVLKQNRMLLSKCYAALQDYKQAIYWIDLAKELPVKSDEDKDTEKEIDELLKKFNPYRS